MKNKNSTIIVALDLPCFEEAEKAVQELSPAISWFKVGKELFTAEGPKVVEMIKNEGCKVFLDLKFHDIPNTTSKAVISATRSGADMINLHAGGGFDMMQKSAETLAEYCAQKNIDRPYLIAVTVLTSMAAKDLLEIGISAEPRDQVLRLASLAKEAGIDGVVSSPEEIKVIKEKCGDNFLVVTPGVRPAGSSMDDQKRVKTPKEAIDDGADFIVIGRPIMQADDRLAAARSIIGSISN